MTVETLDGRHLLVPVDHLITPKTVLKLENEGMPIIPSKSEKDVPSPLDPPKRGDMYLKFNI